MNRATRNENLSRDNGAAENGIVGSGRDGLFLKVIAKTHSMKSFTTAVVFVWNDKGHCKGEGG